MKKFLLCLLVTLSCAGVFAQQRPVVAVAPFEVVSGITQADANALTGVFYNRLGNANVVTLVDRSIVERVIREHNFQVGDWSNPQKTAEFGEALNANWIVRGRIERLGASIIVNVQFYDINTFQFRGGTDIALANMNEAYEKMTPLVDRLVQTIRANPNSAVSLYNQLVNATGTVTITVTQDAELPLETVISRTSAITLRGDTASRTVLGNGSNLIKIGRGVTLILENITLRGVGINVNAGGTLIMNNATTITGCYNDDGSVYVSGGTFTMSGGTINGNTSRFGGSVHVVNSGTFTMSGGTISNNNNSYYGNGGGVSVSGTFTMSGGTISGNTSTVGGGVYIDDYGTFTMMGGTISGNTGRNGSGGVSVHGTFTMRGGTISNNTSGLSAGGVYVSDSGTFSMIGGTIAGNRAGTEGGGVYVWDGTFRMTGGTIYGSNGGSNANMAGGLGKGHAVWDRNRFPNAQDLTIRR